MDIDGIAAFLPGSQVDVRPIRNLDSLRNQEIEAKVIKLNRKRSNVVLSRKAVIEEENVGRKDETLGGIEEDFIVEGQIKNLTDYGAFVDLGGVDGLLHVTDMSWGRLQNPAELFKVGDTIQVKVLKFDRDRERVSLGYKQLLPDPWASVEERFPLHTRITGKIASVADYGAFVELENGVEGLVLHRAQLEVAGVLTGVAVVLGGSVVRGDRRVRLRDDGNVHQELRVLLSSDPGLRPVGVGDGGGRQGQIAGGSGRRGRRDHRWQDSGQFEAEPVSRSGQVHSGQRGGPHPGHHHLRCEVR